jgi:kynureninase
MTVTPAGLYASPNALAPYYSAFRVSERLLLTGHSHQAWPDVGFEGQKRAWLDAAEHADHKWDRAFEKWDRVAGGYKALLADREGDVTLASSTHELVVRFLSALPLGERPRIVTTDAEFHSIRRQVDRLAEETWADVVTVPGYPAADVAERLADAVDDRTACVLVSAVFYERGHVVSGLERAAAACARHGAELLVDAYHALGAMPFRLADHGLGGAYVVGGGYKYLQLGEGNCFLRTPPGCTLRPRITGWFSEFGELAEARVPGELRYGRGGARFMGSTFDPTSQYRAAAVLDFFEERGLKPELLREISLHQVGLLVDTFRALDLDPEVVRLDDGIGSEERGGFLALTAAGAGALREALGERGVRVDHRGTLLRFGPAPYLSDAQLVGAMEALRDAVAACAPNAAG